MIAPDFGYRDMVVLAQTPGDIGRPGRHIQIERSTNLRKVHPLGHRLEVIDRLGCFDFNDGTHPPCSRDVGQHEIRVHQTGA